MPDGERHQESAAEAGSAPEALVRRRLLDKIRETLGKIPFSEHALAAYYAAMDPATPGHVKAALIGALAYFIVPTDLIPDFIAALGYTDDAAVLFAALRMLKGHIRDEHTVRARAFLEQETG